MPVYRTPKKIPLRRRSRTRPVKGTGDDEGKYYRCWNCGFVCDSSRDKSDGSYAGDNHTTGYELAGQKHFGKHEHLYIGLEDRCYQGGPMHIYVGMKLRAEGSTYTETVYHNHKSDISHGCPFCGTTNYMGNK